MRTNPYLLPASVLQFGVIVLTTANGILDHEEARRKKVGGKVLGREAHLG
jgi:small subunit ribosomal protein S15Ae